MFNFYIKVKESKMQESTTVQYLFQEFNTLKEEFNEKFFGDEMDYNGYSNRASTIESNSEEVQELKVSIKITLFTL